MICWERAVGVDIGGVDQRSGPAETNGFELGGKEIQPSWLVAETSACRAPSEDTAEALEARAKPVLHQPIHSGAAAASGRCRRLRR